VLTPINDATLQQLRRGVMFYADRGTSRHTDICREMRLLRVSVLNK
jgi:hypothetical protein